jgi:uncharacterized protein with HEPN domain
MSRHDPLARLLHMRDFARKALELTQGKRRADLENDEVLRLALTRLVELIGAAASRVPLETQAQYPEIPWAKMVSMRNRLIHGYDFGDIDILWDTLRVNLPMLLAQLEAILARGGTA